MEFFRIRRDIPFMRHALILNAISFMTFALAVFFLFPRGLHLSVEFTGGTVMEVAYASRPTSGRSATTVAELGYTDVQVQNFGTSRDVLIRLPGGGKKAECRGAAAVQNEAARSHHQTATRRAVRPSLKARRPLTLRRTEFVGPQVGEELATNGLKALGMVVVGIMIYLAFRFEWKFAVAAIIANLHDVIIILGFFAFFQWEFSLAVLAAVLAVLGYSVNESVVIFDRIRENFRRYRKMNTPRGDRQRDHLHHQPHHHHPRLDPDHGAVDAVLRRPDAALLRAGPDHRHPVRHLFVGLRGRGHRDVAGRQARRPGQGRPSEGRPERSERRGRGVESSVATHGAGPLPIHGASRR